MLIKLNILINRHFVGKETVFPAIEERQERRVSKNYWLYGFVGVIFCITRLHLFSDITCKLSFCRTSVSFYFFWSLIPFIFFKFYYKTSLIVLTGYCKGRPHPFYPSSMIITKTQNAIPLTRALSIMLVTFLQMEARNYI